jgi:hypothetical protein
MGLMIATTHSRLDNKGLNVALLDVIARLDMLGDDPPCSDIHCVPPKPKHNTPTTRERQRRGAESRFDNIIALLECLDLRHTHRPFLIF